MALPIAKLEEDYLFLKAQAALDPGDWTHDPRNKSSNPKLMTRAVTYKKSVESRVA